MLAIYQILLLASAAIYVTFRIAGAAWDSYRARRLATSLSCKPATQADTGFLGIPGFYRLVQAVKNKTWLPYMDSQFDIYGHTFAIPRFAGDMFMTREPDLIKALLATQFQDFGLGMRYPHFEPLLGDGIFTLDGEGWSHSRTLLRPQFSREQVADIQQMDVHVGHLMSNIPSDGKAFDIQELFFRLTLDSATEFLFGESVNSLVETTHTRAGVPVKSTAGKLGFEAAFNLSQDYLAARTRAQNLYWLINPKEFREANRTVHQLVDYYVRLALEPKAKKEKAPHERERYIFLEALAEDNRDPKSLRDQMLNILLAGRDTTASLLSSAFYSLAKNPDVWHKLRHEVLNKFGTAEDPREKITFSALKDIPYLRYVLDETLRLYPPVPLNARTALRDTTLPFGGGADGQSPLFIRKGLNVGYSIWSMHRRTDLWGEDAAIFRPERWEGAKLKSWQFLPFNGGPRICLGQQYALTEAGFVIVKLLQHFDTIESADSRTGDPLINANVTMSLEHGAHIRLFSKELPKIVVS